MPIRFSCSCGRNYETDEAHAGKKAKCPACGQVLTIPVPRAEEPLIVGGTPQPPVTPSSDQAFSPSERRLKQHQAICVICQWPIEPDAPKTECPACHAVYHKDCWEVNRGCGVYGCPQVPPTEKWEDKEIPVSYWGQEHKICPVCHAEILAAAVRCRQCGATFPSAHPEAADEFLKRTALNSRLPQLRRSVVWLFVLSVLPFCAPFAAVFGTRWYFLHREEIKALPSLHAAMSRIAIGVAIGQTVLTALMGLLVTVLHG